MKCPMEVGVVTGPVTVGFVERPDIVWVSKDTPREELMDKVEEAKLEKLPSVQVGCVAATIFSEDEALYRVSVLNVTGAEVEVRYCDYGNKEMKGVDELFKLPDDLANHEHLAVKVRVEGVKGVGDSSKNRARVEKKLSVDGLMVKLVEENGEYVGTFEVGGKKIKFSKSKEVAETKAVESISKLQPIEENENGSGKGVVQEEAKIDRVDDLRSVSKPTSDGNGARACDEHEVKIPVEMRGGDVAGVEKMKNVYKGDGIDEMVAGVRDKPDMEVKESPEVDVVDEIVTEVKVPESSSKIVMYNELPNLKLLEGVEISGTVVYVSPLGGVWFCPQWIQGSLDTLSVQVDDVAAENKLVSMCRNNMKEGILCIARSPQDGELYRARIVCIDSNKVTVAFIDFGNSDLVTEANIYELPPGLEMLAPASAEVVLARELPKQNTQQVMEETLMEAENLILVLEEESGVKVGKFYSNGKEVRWDMMVETKKVFEKDRIDEENNEEDVVVEEETVLRNNDVKEDKVEAEVKTVGEVKPLKKPDPSKPRLIRLVPSLPFNIGVEESVFVVHVESSKIVWVSRESDEVRISLLMDKLARLSEEFEPAQRMKKGAVYGTRFSEDGELYRAVLKNVDESGALVQFIDFGNKEMKEEHELFDIPVEIGSEPAGAISVELKTSMEVNEESRAIVEQLLEGENLSVTLLDDGPVFKKGGEGLVFERVMSRQSTSSDMFTMRDVTQSIPVDPVPEVMLDKSLLLNETETGLKTTEVAEIKPMINDEKETTTSLIAQDTACTTRTTPGNSVNPVPSVSSKAPNTTSLSSVIVTEPVPSVVNCTASPSNVCTPHVRTVPIPVQVAPQPVPTRNFAKAISDLQNQLQGKTAKKDTQVKQKERGRLSEWSEGDLVVARRPDGVWMNATIVTMNTAAGKAKVTCDGEEVIVELINVRSPSLPVEALNLIDQGLSEKNIVRQKGDGESREKSIPVPSAVVGKVKDWMDKNIAQLRQDVANSCHQDECKGPKSPPLESTSKQSLEQIPLPPSHELASYSRTSKGSLHIQSVLNINDAELNNHVLSSLLTSELGPLSLMTSPKSSYVIQKLITVLPSTNLKPILNIVVANFTHLSLDSAGCRVVQSLLEFSSPDQQSLMTSLLCTSKTLLTLVTDRHGTYVAQACLPHITPSPDTLMALVNALLGHTAMLGKHQCGTFFLQRLVGILSTHYPGSATTCLLQEDILANIAQLVITEPGSRLIQALLKDSQPAVLIRVARWIQENKKVVVITKPTVHAAVEVSQLLVDRLGDEEIWGILLDRVYRSFLELDKDSADKKSVLMTAALHPVGHLLAKDMVAKVNYVGESCKKEVLHDLAVNVDELSLDKFGSIVLKGLVGTIE